MLFTRLVLPSDSVSYFLLAGDAAIAHMCRPKKPSMGAGYYLLGYVYGILAKAQLVVLFSRFFASVRFRILLPALMLCGKSPHAFPNEAILGGGRELFIVVCLGICGKRNY